MLPKLSCAISGISRAGSVFDSIKTVKDAGFDGVDFPLSTYSRQTDSALAKDAWWREWVTAVRTYLFELSLPVMQAHAPWEQSIPKDFSYEPPYPIYYRAMEACAMLDCRKLVFHPLLYPYRVAEPAQFRQIDGYNRRWFRELLPTAARLGITVEIENMFDYYHVQQPCDPAYPYTTPAHMLALAESLGPEIRLCLDTGHANIAGQDVPGMIRAYGEKLDCLHLNDNYGRSSGLQEDLHLLPGEGTLPWREIFHALREIGYAGTYNLELIANLAQLDSASRTETLACGRKNLLDQLR